MTAENIDKLNIGLVIAAFVAAIYLPFELFLFSYAFLGPLHYLTEINWLQKRSYFISHKRNWIWVLILMGLLLSINTIFAFLDVPSMVKVGSAISEYTSQILLGCFLFAVSLVVLKKRSYVIISVPVIIILSWAMHGVIPLSNIIIGSFLPTLVHVYLFTIFFMIYGTMKSKSRYGIYSIVFMILVPVLIYVIDVEPGVHGLVGNTREAFTSTGFAKVSARLAGMMGWIEGRDFDIISQIGIKIQIFIAFAYTYHYLNWFSKTSVIGWKKTLNSQSFILILIVWAASVALYLYDYSIGLAALFLLSFLHVLLEFPLNVITIKEVFRGLRVVK